MANKRRTFLSKLALAPIIISSNKLLAFSSPKPIVEKKRLQYSINAYSFNSELRSGEMTFFDMMEFAADIGMDAIDLTGYYFSSYPEIPENSELFALKRKALELGLDIAWTGVRNNFVTPDASARKKDVELIKNWLKVSSKLGATIMRIFTGKADYNGFTKDDVKEWLVKEYKTCATYGEEHGVIVALQNHDEFLFTSDEVIDIIKRVDSEWFGLILDTGSLPSENTYDDIEKLAPYGNYWFIKEHVKTKDSVKVPVDLKKMASIIKNQGYQGYVSFESLSEGDTKEIIRTMFHTFKSEFEKL